jgi:hypothetical protein
MLRVGFPVDVEGELQERAEALFPRPQCRLGAFVIRNVHHRSTRPSVPFSRPTPRTARPIRVSRGDFRPKAATRPKRARKTSGTSLIFECRSCPMKRRRPLPAPVLRRARPQCRFAARVRVDSHVHVRRCTNTSRERAESLVRSLPRRRGMSQRDLERTLGRLPTDASFRRGSFPEPGPRLSRAQTSVWAHEPGSAAVAHLSPPVMAASAITRNDRLSAATVAIH